MIVFGNEKTAPKRLDRAGFQAIVRLHAAEGRVALTRHVREDHPERGITPAMIQRCLLKGTVQGDPYLSQGNWTGEIFRHAAGEALTVAVAIDWGRRLIVITAYR